MTLPQAESCVCLNFFMADMEGLRERLKKAQDATAAFDAQHKGVPLSAQQEEERKRLLRAELEAHIAVTAAQERIIPVQDMKP